LAAVSVGLEVLEHSREHSAGALETALLQGISAGLPAQERARQRGVTAWWVSARKLMLIGGFQCDVQFMRLTSHSQRLTRLPS
jgi:hypothetical protein